MLFDTQLLFFHAGTAYGFTTGEFVSLVGNTSVTASCTSSVINLGVQEDMGIGDGEFIPKCALILGSSGITSSCASLQLNFQFQGSTDSTTWTTYDETGWAATSSYLANTEIFLNLPRRPASWNSLPTGLPQYYRINIAANGAGVTGTAWIATVGISTGSIIGGIVIQRNDADDTFGKYAAGFSVV